MTLETCLVIRPGETAEIEMLQICCDRSRGVGVENTLDSLKYSMKKGAADIGLIEDQYRPRHSVGGSCQPRASGQTNCEKQIQTHDPMITLHIASLPSSGTNHITPDAAEYPCDITPAIASSNSIFWN